MQRATQESLAGHPAPMADALRHHAQQLADIISWIGESGLGAVEPARPPLNHDVVELAVSKLIRQAEYRAVTAQINYASWPVHGESALFERLHNDLLARGGHVHILVPRESIADEGFAGLRALARCAAAVRMHSYALPTMAILDGSFGAISVAGDGGGRKVLAVRDPRVVRTLQAFYETIWKHAVDLAHLPAGMANWITDGVVLRVLELLCLGYTDEVAARKLALSVRTYRRYVAGVMRQMKVNSRFQAGVRAAQLGLVTAFIADGAQD